MIGSLWAVDTWHEGHTGTSILLTVLIAYEPESRAWWPIPGRLELRPLRRSSTGALDGTIGCQAAIAALPFATGVFGAVAHINYRAGNFPNGKVLGFFPSEPRNIPSGKVTSWHRMPVRFPRRAWPCQRAIDGRCWRRCGRAVLGRCPAGRRWLPPPRPPLLFHETKYASFNANVNFRTRQYD